MVKTRKRTTTSKLSKRLKVFGSKAKAEGREHLQENLINRISHVRSIRLLVLEWGLLVSVITILAIVQTFWYSDSYTTTAWTDGGIYTEATLGKINSLNPLFANTSSERTLSKLMFSTLTAPDYSGHTGLGLASSIRANDTGSIWTVKLRDGLKWSDGESLSNADVLYTVSVLKDSSLNSAYSSNLSGVKLEESENGELIFTLPTAYANFPSALGFPILPAHILSDVSPNKLLEHTFSSAPVTSGPFAYNATQNIGTTGERIIYLTPNQNYYRGKPMLDGFSVHAYTTLDDIKNVIKSGTVTATAELSPTDSEIVTSRLITERQSAISSGVFLFFNLQDGRIFSSKGLRKAVQQGLDMRSLRAPLGDELPLDYPLTSNQVSLSAYPTLPEYDPETAKATITSVDEAQRQIRLVTTNTGYFPALAENLKYQLERLGFSVDVQTYSANQDFILTVLRPRDYDILLYEIELGADPDLFAYYHASQATESGLNLSNYVNALASDLLLAARGTMNINTRNTKYQAFLNHWVEDVPAIGINQVNFSYYVNHNVHTFSQDNNLVSPLDRFIDVCYWSVEKTTKDRTP